MDALQYIHDREVPAAAAAVTKASPAIADVPALIGARVLARSYLDQAEQERRRVLEDADPEALHDFRVAVRRLRSSLRAYRTQLGDTVKGRHRRWLRRLMRSTNEGRDLEVQLALLAKRRTDDEAEARGAAWLATRLRERTWAARAEALRAIRHDFPRGRDRLRRALSRYRAAVDPARPRPDSTAGVAGAVLLVLASELEADMAALRSADVVPELHRARITGKRLRYLLEPFELQVTNGRQIVQKLKRLQDALGDLNDRCVLIQRIEQESAALLSEEPESTAAAALAALLARVTRDRDTRFGRVRRRWTDGQLQPLLAQLRAAADELRARGEPVSPLEIERKFLLRRMPRLPPGARVHTIDQGWLPGERLLERVRRVRSTDGTRYYRTVKTGAGIQRGELEEETSEELFRALWRLTRGRRSSKRRYRVEENGVVWEIDRFPGGRLVLAEVELPSADASVKPPDWLEPHIVREVTGEPAYLNVTLAS